MLPHLYSSDGHLLSYLLMLSSRSAPLQQSNSRLVAKNALFTVQLLRLEAAVPMQHILVLSATCNQHAIASILEEAKLPIMFGCIDTAERWLPHYCVEH